MVEPHPDERGGPRARRDRSVTYGELRAPPSAACAAPSSRAASAPAIGWRLSAPTARLRGGATSPCSACGAIVVPAQPAEPAGRAASASSAGGRRRAEVLDHVGRRDRRARARRGHPPAPLVDVERRRRGRAVFTSGTAGAPRAAMLTHGNLRANLDQMASGPDRLRPDDVVLGVLPLFHIFGLERGARRHARGRRPPGARRPVRSRAAPGSSWPASGSRSCPAPRRCGWRGPSRPS